MEETEVGVTSRQVKAARALLGMNQTEFSKLVGVPMTTLGKLEAKDGALKTTYETVLKIVEAVRPLGVRFVRGGVVMEGTDD